ncbi:glycosyltransferase [Legionella israelensis]|uniref:Glycosyltransferase n=1 Tax=Legionella israelensis TaxID=454 RepID=A0AAX1EHE3_9GAMM|nr:glycosyltransferase [Legionella israelensis]QBR84531.1 glycosyltransferase [Legionella israelensis]
MCAIISYLIPSYNHARYLPEFLDNIRSDIEQMDLSAEVILLDDGSTDNSVSIIESWAEENKNKFKIVYKTQENKGITAVLNSLVDMAEGEYLRLCASDDVIVPGSTQMLYQQFKEYPELSCVLGDAIVIDENSNILHESSIAYHGGKRERLQKPEQLVKELIQNWCVAGPSHLIKKNHYQHIRYDESARIDDYDLFLSLLYFPNSVFYVNITACLYRIHTSNTSKTKDPKQRIENIKSFLTIINKHLEHDALKHYLLPVKYKTTAKIYYLEKKYIRCVWSMVLSLFFNLKDGS